MKLKKQIRLVTCWAAALLLSTINQQLSTCFAQGSLTPPGAPAPTMKTLDQVEARTPVDATHTPGDATYQFIISAPGSYYLTGNITGVSNNLYGIGIKADNVTLDLNGFVLSGVPGQPYQPSGIYAPAPQKNLRIHNGSVEKFSGNGIDFQEASNCQFDHLRVSQNAGVGLYCGKGSVLSDCSAETNGVFGIVTQERSTMTACTAAKNLGDGIKAYSECTVTACNSSENSGTGFNIYFSCTITACTADANNQNGISPSDGCTIKDCTANQNSITGISCGNQCIVKDCTANYNASYGISCGSDCLITGNTVSYNFTGIHVGSGGLLNRIDGNTANHNTHVGILWLNDVVIRNSAFLNSSANYSPAVGIGNTGPLNAASTSTSPWANF